MPTFTVYSLGDVASYWSMLNGVAMFFGQTSFWASAALTGSLMLLLLIMVSMLASAGGGKGGHNPFLGPMYLGATFVFMSITSSVVVQDIYTGNIIQVDNIPLIIALPSSLSTTAAYKVFKYADTAFQSVDGSYMSVSANGMVSPLKSLMSMRKGFAKSAPTLALTVKTFAMYCTPNSGFQKSQYLLAPKSTDYLLKAGNYNASNLTFNYPAGGTEPVATNCGEVAKDLVTRIATYMKNTSAEGKPDTVISGNMAQNPKPDKTPQKFADAEMAITNVVASNLASAGQSAQTIMENMLFYDVINLGMACAGTSTSAEDANACWTEQAVIRQSLEQWKSDSAGQGTLFSKIMTPAITFMQLMFYGFSPLILLVCLFMGEKSLGLFSKYLIFGVWTVSWLPFSSVIQMYIQNQLADRVKAMTVGTNGIVAGNMSEYYDMVSTNLALASDLLAATPMISFALLTGSTMAMTGLAKRWSGDNVDEKVVSPNIMTNKGLHEQAARANSDSLTTTRSGTGAMIPSLTRTHDAGTSMQSASQLGIGAGKDITKTATNLMNKIDQDQYSNSNEKAASNSLKSALSNSNDHTMKVGNGLDKSAGLSAAQKKVAQAGLALKIPLTELGIGFSGTSDEEKKAAANYKETYGNEYAAGIKANKELSASVTNANKSVKTHTGSTSASEAQAAATAVKKTEMVADSFTTAAASANKMAVTTNIDAGYMGGSIHQDPKKAEMANSILTGLGSSNNANDRQAHQDILARSKFFRDNTSMRPESSDYAALSEYLGLKAASGKEGSIEAGSQFDALSPSIGPSISKRANENENIANANELRAEAIAANSNNPDITKGSVAPKVEGYNPKNFREPSAPTEITQTQVAGADAGTLATASGLMGAFPDPTTMVEGETGEAQQAIKTGQKVINNLTADQQATVKPDTSSNEPTGVTQEFKNAPSQANLIPK